MGTMQVQMESLTKKMKYMESGHRWNNSANEKQFMYNAELRQIVVEDYRMVLEKYFGRNKMEVLARIEDVVKKGEKKIDERIKMLRMADKASWRVG